MKFISIAVLMAATEAKRHHHHVHHLVQLQAQNDPQWNSDDGYSTKHYADEGEGQKPKLSFPNGYFVPQFGVDDDVKTTLRNVADAEDDLGVRSNFGAAPGAPHPVDYFVP